MSEKSLCSVLDEIVIEEGVGDAILSPMEELESQKFAEVRSNLTGKKPTVAPTPSSTINAMKIQQKKKDAPKEVDIDTQLKKWGIASNSPSLNDPNMIQGIIKKFKDLLTQKKTTNTAEVEETIDVLDKHKDTIQVTQESLKDIGAENTDEVIPNGK